MKLIIAGSRDFTDYQLLIDTLREEGFTSNTVTTVVSGCAHGADKLGERWAVSQCIPIARFPADWDSYGKRAGFVRNGEMAEYADACIVFWNGSSKGTKHMADIAKRKKGMRVVVVTIKPVVYMDSF
jgi:hypothetical protein